MENWIIETMENFGYFGILLLIMLENIFPPIPSEVILTFGGAMTVKTSMTITGVVTVSTIGSVLGAIILYFIGSLLDIRRLEKIIEKWGHILRLKKADLYKADRWFDNFGYWTVFFCRFIPLIRSLISLPAGMAKMNFGIFLFLTTIGTFTWNFVLIRIGATVGDSWEDIVHYMDMYSNVAYVILAVIGLAVIGLYIYKRVIKQK
ncbi:DedA family protein [Niallia circulans]|uniref:DedA family protein n=1 Tax=Niallia circulans TaxID=1397 RepID=UPI0026F2228F|nr:DedA family protein [Niallia circulans]